MRIVAPDGREISQAKTTYQPEPLCLKDHSFSHCTRVVWTFIQMTNLEDHNSNFKHRYI